jgi:exoribonuclease R
MAELVAISIGDLKVCQYMEPHIGEKLAATIHSVSPAGMVVALDAFNVTAFLPTKVLGDRAVVKGPTLTVRAGRRMLSFNEGSPIAVRLKEVDFIRLQLLLELA